MIEFTRTHKVGYAKLEILDKKAHFARVLAALGWSALYHGSCIDPTNQSHTLNPPPDLPFPISKVTIQLLIKDMRRDAC